MYIDFYSLSFHLDWQFEPICHMNIKLFYQAKVKASRNSTVMFHLVDLSYLQRQRMESEN